MIAYLGLGSNVGDRRQYLTDAIRGLNEVVKVSPLYETDPVGNIDEQDSYLNCVVAIEWDGSPRELLIYCQNLEQKAGRVRREKWAPRTLDVDILLIGSLNVHEPDLNIPHPRMFERRFVMQPLADIAPEVLPENWSSLAEGNVRPVAPLTL